MIVSITKEIVSITYAVLFCLFFKVLILIKVNTTNRTKNIARNALSYGRLKRLGIYDVSIIYVFPILSNL